MCQWPCYNSRLEDNTGCGKVAAPLPRDCAAMSRQRCKAVARSGKTARSSAKSRPRRPDHEPGAGPAGGSDAAGLSGWSAGAEADGEDAACFFVRKYSLVYPALRRGSRQKTYWP